MSKELRALAEAESDVNALEEDKRVLSEVSAAADGLRALSEQLDPRAQMGDPWMPTTFTRKNSMPKRWPRSVKN